MRFQPRVAGQRRRWSRKRRLASSRIFFSSMEVGNLKSNCSSRLRSGKPASCVRTLMLRSCRTLASLSSTCSPGNRSTGGSFGRLARPALHNRAPFRSGSNAASAVGCVQIAATLATSSYTARDRCSTSRREEPAADSRTRRQLQWAWRTLQRRCRSAWTPSLHQPRIVRRVNHHDATSFGQAMLSDDFDLAINLDTAAGHWLPHQDGLASEAERYRVTIAAIAEHAVFGHTAIFHVAGVVIGKLVDAVFIIEVRYARSV